MQLRRVSRPVASGTGRRRRALPLLATLVVVTVLAGFAAFSNDKVIEESESLRLRDRRSLVDALARSLDHASSRVAGFSFDNVPLTLTAGSPEDRAVLQRMVGPLGTAAIVVLGLDGTLLNEVSSDAAPPPAGDPGYERMLRQLANGAPGGVIAARSSGVTWLGVGAYVNRGGSPAAVAVPFVRLDGLEGALQVVVTPYKAAVAERADNGMLVVNADRMVLASWDENRIGTVLPNEAPWTQVTGGRAGHLEFEQDGVRRIAVYVPAENYDYVAVFVEDAAEFYGTVRDNNQRSNLAMLAGLLAAAVAVVALIQRRQRTIAASEERLAALLQNAADAVLVVRDDHVVYASPGVEQVFDRPADDVTGKPVELLIATTEDEHPVLDVCREAATRPDGVVQRQVAFVTSARERRWVSITAEDLRGNRSVGGIILTCHDVTEPTRLQERLAHQALHDPLTGLPNRALLANRLDMAFKRRKRTGRTVAVLFLDLDRFKPVNDTYGHKAGDRVLRAIGARLRAALREGDTLARMGGDEFAVLVDEAGSTVDLVDVARRLVAAVDRPVDIGSSRVKLGVSIGIAVADEDDHDPDELLQRADAAMYAAKDGGGERWRLATPGSNRSGGRIAPYAARSVLQNGAGTATDG